MSLIMTHMSHVSYNDTHDDEASCWTNYPTIYISQPQYKQKVAFLRIHLFLALYSLPAPRVDNSVCIYSVVGEVRVWRYMVYRPIGNELMSRCGGDVPLLTASIHAQICMSMNLYTYRYVCLWVDESVWRWCAFAYCKAPFTLTNWRRIKVTPRLHV